MKRILIVAPGNKGTMGLRAMGLYQAFALNKELQTKIVFLHKFNDGFDIEGHEYCDVYSNSKIKKVFTLYNEVRWLKKIKKQFQPNVSISTIIACNICNVLAGGDDFKIGQFRAPYWQNVRSISWVYRALFPYVFPKLDRLVGVSEEVTRSIQENFSQIPTEKFSTIYNAFFIDDILQKMNDPLEKDEDQIFDTPTILYVCRLNTLKAPERLIHAFGRSEIRNRYNLVFVGGDSENRQIELADIAKSYGIDNRVFFLGAKKNPYKYMHRATYFASSSISEGLPGVIIESLIVGTPVISTNCSFGVWEILSCSNRYKSDLDDIYIAENGIITSNGTDVEVNMRALTKALNIIESQHFEGRDFKFVDCVNPKNVVDQYLDLIPKGK